MLRFLTCVAVLALALATAGGVAGYPLPAAPACPIFPDTNVWNKRVDHLPVARNSRTIVRSIGRNGSLHPDFGSGRWDGGPIGIPITVVGSGQRRSAVRFEYADESDRGPYPIPESVRIEGGPNSDGDRHAIIVDKSTCRLYELYALSTSGGRWHAGSGATWSLRKNKLRPDGWTSADAAGLPILPGLLRWNEVRTNRIDHAIRFTTDVTSSHHLWPARHDAGSTDSLDYPPMGARFRLQASYDASGLSPHAQAVVAAMKKYGLVLADNGSPWYFQGEQHGKWPIKLIEDLKTIPASAFVAVDTSSLMVSPNSAAVQ
jgi:hypothetical protein